jgi:hypothetical protein
MAQLEMGLRGLPEWLIRAYLEEMGAAVSAGEPADEPRAFECADDEWAVRWTVSRAEIPGGGSLGFTQLDLVFEAEEAYLPELEERFMKKAQRGGG